MNKEQQALDELRDLVHSELDGTRMLDEYLKHCDTLQQLVDLHKKIKKDVEFLNEKDIQIFFLPDGKEILGYNITECPSRILLAEAMRKNIEKILKCLNRSNEDDK